jgi:hypothetical protein
VSRAEHAHLLIHHIGHEGSPSHHKPAQRPGRNLHGLVIGAGLESVHENTHKVPKPACRLAEDFGVCKLIDGNDAGQTLQRIGAAYIESLVQDGRMSHQARHAAVADAGTVEGREARRHPPEGQRANALVQLDDKAIEPFAGVVQALSVDKVPKYMVLASFQQRCKGHGAANKCEGLLAQVQGGTAHMQSLTWTTHVRQNPSHRVWLGIVAWLGLARIITSQSCHLFVDNGQ